LIVDDHSNLLSERGLERNVDILHE